MRRSTDVLPYGERVRRAGPDPARGAGQRRGLLDRAGRGRRDRDPVHHRPRHAARLPGADDQDRLEQRPRRAQARLDRLRRRPRARRGHRAGRRRAARHASARSPRAGRPRPSATASARSRSGSAASPCEAAGAARLAVDGGGRPGRADRPPRPRLPPRCRADPDRSARPADARQRQSRLHRRHHRPADLPRPIFAARAPAHHGAMGLAQLPQSRRL